MKLHSLFGFMVAGLIPALAQVAGTTPLAPGNAAGVSMGHMHLTVRDLDASQKFFALLGGKPVQNGPLQLIEFPGMYVMLRKGEPTGGTVGSVVNHFGFQVQNMQDWLPKWQAAGIKMEPMTRPTQVYLITPDDIRIEVMEEKDIKTPVAAEHIHFAGPVLEMQAWYIKTFGAVARKRGPFEAADIPGINLSFSAPDPKMTAAPVTTKGRSLDHIGFEVKNLPAFIAKLEASGIKMDRAYTKVAGSSASIAFLTDPWGTYIELTEGIAPLK